MLTDETVEYRADGRRFEGRLVRMPGQVEPMPGILVFHEFMGLGAYLDRHLNHFAALGYAVFAADMYGKGIRPRDEATALTYSRPLRADRRSMRRRAGGALACLSGIQGVDHHRIAAVGYSFGGCVALELARSGAAIRAAVSLYGYLDTPLPAARGDIKATLLVFHGDHDPVVPKTSLAAYQAEMAAAEADSRVVAYADAGHGFCNPHMDGRRDPWNRYSRRHEETSWHELVTFLADLL